MAFPLYLAMTAAEIAGCAQLPGRVAWMACHFSPYGTGLCNRPTVLPAGSMVILNDRTPIHGHDPDLIAAQLADIEAALRPSCFLLDFQRPDCPETAAVAKAVTEAVSCPVGISDLYAKALACPVFLPPVPPHCLPHEYLFPWQGREVWLELDHGCEQITLTESGPQFDYLQKLDETDCPHADPELHCHYKTQLADDRIILSLCRTAADRQALMEAAFSLGVTQAVGLYQEFGQ